MKRLLKVKPGGRGVGTVLPEQNGFYYPLTANAHPAIEEFYGTAIDTDDWQLGTVSTLGTGGATVSVSSSFACLYSGTGTAGSATLKLQSAGYSGSTPAHIYNIPFRVRFVARIGSTAANATSLSPTGGFDAYMGIRNIADNLSQNAVAAETHIAQFHLDLTTAGGSGLGSPVVETQVYAGSTAAGFIASAAFNPFATGASGIVKTSSALVGYVIEATHRGTWFSIIEDPTSQEPGRLLTHVSQPTLRPDLNYYIDARLVANGTAGFTGTGQTSLEIDQIVLTQFTTQDQSADIPDSDKRVGGIRTWTNTSGTYTPTLAAALVTSGMGILYAVNISSTNTGGLNLYIAAYDASAAGSAVYNYSFTGGSNTISAAARLLFVHQWAFQNSAPALVAAGQPPAIPACGIPFFRGLVIGDTTVNGGAVGGSALQASVVYRSQ